jgi:hypothetical protein
MVDYVPASRSRDAGTDASSPNDPLNAVTLPRTNPGVVFQKLDEGAVLFAPATELYFGLNDVGAMIWELLPRARSHDEVYTTLHTTFPDVDLGVIRADVDDLLARLLAEGLLVGSVSSGGDDAPGR